jgi:hypothetical protein
MRNDATAVSPSAASAVRAGFRQDTVELFVLRMVTSPRSAKAVPYGFRRKNAKTFDYVDLRNAWWKRNVGNG